MNSARCSCFAPPAVRQDRRPGRRAFTIVELLVVIGIIGLLMSILMPALSRARQQANAVQCMVRLRTLAQAWTMYADANTGVSCPGRMPTVGSLANGMPVPPPAGPGVYYLDNGNQYRPRWYELLGGVIKQFPCRSPRTTEDDSWTIDNPQFLCAAVPEWTNSRNYVYGYNHQFLGNPRPRADGRWVNWPVKATRIRSAETVMAMDSMGTAAGKPAKDRLGYYADGTKDEWAFANKGFLVDPPRLTAASDYADTQKRSPEHRSGPDPRHAGRANVAFCDGHVEALTPGDMGYVVREDGSVAANGPGTHNRMFSGTGQDEDPPPVQ